MATTQFWLLRHAPVVDNGGLVYGGGEIDADISHMPTFEALAAMLPKFDAVYCSSLSRTAQTLAAIRAAGRDDLPVAPPRDPRLNEQHLGDWHGQPIKDVFKKASWPWPGFWMVAADFTPPGGENFEAVCARGGAALEDSANRHGGGTVLLGTHGGVIRAALGHALGLAPAAAQAFSVETCSLSRLDRIQSKSGRIAWRIAGQNWTV